MNFWKTKITMLGYFELVVDDMQNCILQNKHRNFWILGIKYIT
ncbi:hypothetical protein C797_17150 [Bacillus thuringiensis Sbt003]|uniref:Uncharacterized protein n=1 Tax=Bacillus thuringiensis Sbt003 TaxID=1235825 RepID=A0A9X0F7Q6_BACTU|nr:hypothetical protein C797_17150 [Bacillus thuringiensis Sbt003]